MTAVDPAVVEVAKAFVLRRFAEAANVSTDEERMPILDEVAALIVGTGHREVLAEFAAAMREELEANRAALQVQKRQAEQQMKLGLATFDAALAALAPPANRAARRSSGAKKRR